MARGWQGGLAALALSALAACGGGDDTSFAERLAARTAQSPDEFRVLPNKPLELPEDLSALPPPVPGAPNRSDLTPEDDVLVALSGRPVRANPGASDRALLAAIAGGGVSPTIRSELRAEDRAYREANRGLLLERWAGLDTEYAIYERQRLDPVAEYERLRGLGIRLPPLPPVE